MLFKNLSFAGLVAQTTVVPAARTGAGKSVGRATVSAKLPQPTTQNEPRKSSFLGDAFATWASAGQMH